MQHIKKALGFSHTGASSSSSDTPTVKPWILLVIDVKKNNANWEEIFANETVHGRPVSVKVGSWDTMRLSAYSRSGLRPHEHAVVDIIKRNVAPQPDGRVQYETVIPDFVLIRALPRGTFPNQDYRNVLLGLKFANVPAVNSLQSVWLFQDRPWLQSELLALSRRLGRENFPVVDQTYYSTHADMLIGPSFPAVVKVGHAHAGFGKMKIDDHHSFADFRSVLALSPHYCTAEPFLKGDHDLRIQVIGQHVRVFKRVSVSGNWKTNVGSSIMDHIEVSDKHRMWAEECRSLMGGLDIFSIDSIVTQEGQEYVMEVNDCSIGLHPDFAEEDHVHMKQLVLERMAQLLPAPVSGPSPATTPTSMSSSP